MILDGILVSVEPEQMSVVMSVGPLLGLLQYARFNTCALTSKDGMRMLLSI